MNTDNPIVDAGTFSITYTTAAGCKVRLAGMTWATTLRRALRLRSRGCHDFVIRGEPRTPAPDAHCEPAAEGRGARHAH